MIEEFEGPYSWNRVSQRLNPAWMREWPESFLTPQASPPARSGEARRPAAPPVRRRITSGQRRRTVSTCASRTCRSPSARRTADALLRRRPEPRGAPREAPRQVSSTELEILSSGSEHVVVHDGQRLGGSSRRSAARRSAEAARRADPGARATATRVAAAGRPWRAPAAALVIAGDLGDGRRFDRQRHASPRAGSLLEDRTWSAIRIQDQHRLPFGAEDSSRRCRRPQPDADPRRWRAS